MNPESGGAELRSRPGSNFRTDPDSIYSLIIEESVAYLLAAELQWTAIWTRVVPARAAIPFDLTFRDPRPTSATRYLSKLLRDPILNSPINPLADFQRKVLLHRLEGTTVNRVREGIGFNKVDSILELPLLFYDFGLYSRLLEVVDAIAGRNMNEFPFPSERSQLVQFGNYWCASQTRHHLHHQGVDGVRPGVDGVRPCVGLDGSL